MKKVNTKAPHVAVAPKDKPNAFFREKLPLKKDKSPQSPLSKKRLSK